MSKESITLRQEDTDTIFELSRVEMDYVCLTITKVSDDEASSQSELYLKKDNFDLLKQFFKESEL